jgi:hypothetical protein
MYEIDKTMIKGSTSYNLMIYMTLTTWIELVLPMNIGDIDENDHIACKWVSSTWSMAINAFNFIQVIDFMHVQVWFKGLKLHMCGQIWLWTQFCPYVIKLIHPCGIDTIPIFKCFNVIYFIHLFVNLFDIVRFHSYVQISPIASNHYHPCDEA